ncbi:polyadenylate-binding protein 1-like protein [Euroglyphus maynei]|uniref:Polyadenylate-binding protein n=1 Tax=Euroglyphus maynei TaxID=6958 RepID=A0A1Y3BH63_EURMA|nr:polyadenylate-binding protein 1-like protein [Euroglyphus maynei]
MNTATATPTTAATATATTTNTNSSGNHYPIASLYVGDLAHDVTEAVLFEKFSSVGPVLSIRVCRDIITRRSLGYAYVNYQNSSDAETAIDTLNFERLNGRPIRIMWSQRDPSLRRSGVGNIFIKNLEKSVDNKVLFDTFSYFGNILSCKISYDDKGQSKGYGFVHFDSEETAQAAISGLNGKVINSKKIYVGKFISRKEREHKLGTPRRFTNIYLKNLSDEYDTDEKVRKLFEPFGSITSAVVTKDDDGKSKGFGFVCFATPDQAEQAVNALNGKDMGNGKQLYVGRAQKKAEREAELKRKLELLKIERINRSQGVNLYVKNLEDSVNDERLQKEFSAYGTITSAKVMTDEKGRSKGFGFVCFSTPEEATKAVTEMNNRIIESKPLYVALAQRKEDREAQKLNTMRFGPTNVRLHQPMPPQAGHPHHPLAPAQMPFANPASLAGFAGLQGQPVQGPQSQPYLLPIAPNTHIQRGYYPSNGPAAMPPGSQGPAGGIRMARWNTNAGIPRGQMSYNQQGFQRNMPPRGQHQNMPRPGVMQGPAPNQGGPRPFVSGPVTANGAVNVRGPGRGPQTGGIRGPNKSMVATPGGQPLPSHGVQQAHLAPIPILAEQQGEDPTQILGKCERLFPLVQQFQPELASKITGMLLEMDTQEIVHMLENQESLRSKVDEALAVLQAHRAKEMVKKD